jgi:hypothetical protein
LSKLYVTTLPQKNAQLISLVNPGSKNKKYTLFCATPRLLQSISHFWRIHVRSRNPIWHWRWPAPPTYTSLPWRHTNTLCRLSVPTQHTRTAIQPNRLAGPAQPTGWSSSANSLVQLDQEHDPASLITPAINLTIYTLYSKHVSRSLLVLPSIATHVNYSLPLQPV